MKSHKRLRQYLSERTERVTDWLTKPAHEISMHDIHALRVDLKQIRTLLECIEQSVPSFSAGRYFKPFLALFREAGILREQQLYMLALLSSDYPALPDAFWREKYRETEQSLTLFLMLLTGRWKKRIKRSVKNINPCLKRIPADKAQRKLIRLQQSIRNRLLAGVLHKQDIHHLRMDIKKLRYLEKAFGIGAPDNKSTDDFQELLGRWHDHRVIISDLRHDIRQCAGDKPLKHALKSIRKNLRLKEAYLFDQILHARQAYLKAMATSDSLHMGD